MSTRDRDPQTRVWPLCAGVARATAAQFALPIVAAWSEWLVRVAVLVLVALLHGSLAALLGTTLWTHGTRRASAEGEVLKIRFVTRSAPPPMRAVPLVPPRQKTVLLKRSPPAALPGEPDKAPALQWQQRPAMQMSVANYVAGGRGFRADLRAAQTRAPVVQLPGSSQPVVAGLHLVDPRSQGISGAVRMLAGLFGATDPHCVAVDSWRSLSTQEMLDRHISPDEVDRVAADYHCRPR